MRLEDERGAFKWAESALGLTLFAYVTRASALFGWFMKDAGYGWGILMFLLAGCIFCMAFLTTCVAVSKATSDQTPWPRSAVAITLFAVTLLGLFPFLHFYLLVQR